TLRSDLPPRVDAVIRKALAKNRDERYASAGELAAAFKQALLDQPLPRKVEPAVPAIDDRRSVRPVRRGDLTVTPSRKGNGRLILGVVGTLGLALLIGAAALLASRNNTVVSTPT